MQWYTPNQKSRVAMKFRPLSLTLCLVLLVQLVLSAAPAPVRAAGDEPDILLADDFSAGNSDVDSTKWRDPFNVWLDDDWLDPADNRVMIFGAENSYDARVTTVQSFSDFTLQFRARYQTPWQTYPRHDNAHWPFATVEIGGAKLEISHIWNSFLLYDPDGTIVKGISIPTRQNQWYTYSFVKRGNQLRVLLDGVEKLNHTFSNLSDGPIKFGATHMWFWVDDVTVTAHPEANLYDTFRSGIQNAWTNTSGWSVVTETDGNKALYVDARGSTSSLFQTTASYDNYVLRFKAKQRRTSGSPPSQWSAATRGSNSSWFGAQYQMGSQLALGSQSDSTFTTAGTALTSDLPADDTWTEYAIVADGNRYRLFVNGTQRIDTTAPSGLTTGFAGFQAQNMELWIDDVLIRPLHVPITNFTFLRYGNNYDTDDTKGYKLSFKNDDFMAHDYVVEYQVTNAGGSVVDSETDSFTLQPGASITDRELSVDVTSRGVYTLTAVLKSDGRTVQTYAKTLTVFDPIEDALPFYWDTFGWAGAPSGSQDAQALAGLRQYRSSIRGKKQSDGSWDFKDADATLKTLKDKGFTLYNITMDINNQQNTLAYRRSYAAELGALAEHYADEPRFFHEVWNEVNHGGFWPVSPVMLTESVSLIQAVYNSIKDADPDAVVVGPSYSGAPKSQLEQQFSMGLYDYLDQLSYHPYEYPNAPETIILPRFKELQAVVDQYGGWLEHVITEQGYATGTAGNATSEEGQAQSLVRFQLLGRALDGMRGIQLYNFQDSGDEDNNVEHRFGSLRSDGTSKPAYVALGTMARQLVNSEYIGDYNTDDNTYVHVYRKYNGQLVLVAWATKATSVTLPLGVSSVTQTAMDGTSSSVETSNGSLTLSLGASPVYLTAPNLNSALLTTAATNQRAERATQITTAIDAITDESTRQELSKAFTKIDTRVAEILGSTDALTQIAKLAQQQPDTLVPVVQEVISAYQAGKLTKAQSGALTEDLYYYGANLGKVVVAALQANPPTPNSSAAQIAITEAQTAITNKAGTDAQLTISQRMLARAQRTYEEGQAAASTHAAVAQVRYLLAEQTAKMAKAMAAAEPVFYRKTVLDAYPKMPTIGAGKTEDVTLTLSNGYNEAFDATLRINYPAAWNQAALTATKTLTATEEWEKVLTLSVPSGISPGDYDLTVEALRGSEVIRTLPIKVRVPDPVSIVMQPLSSKMSDVTSVSFTVTNTGEGTVEGTLTVAGIDGTSLTSTDASFNLAEGASKTISYSYTHGGDTPYHKYVFYVEASDTGGTRLKAQQLTADILLTGITSSAPTIDGTLTDWTSAFPVHLRKGALSGGDLEATLWTLADSNTYYFALEVKDDVHSQPHTGGNTWQADGLQLTLDGANNKDTAYQDNITVELGGALRDNGQLSLWEWAGPNGGDISTLINATIVRDESAKVTRYEFAVPKSMVPGLQTTDGHQYGMNACMNDGDGSDGRDTAQLTLGTCDSKNPSLYQTFKMVSLSTTTTSTSQATTLRGRSE